MDILPHRLRVGDEPEREEIDQRVMVDEARKPRPFQHRLDLRREQERAIDERIMKRLFARPVARAKQPARFGVPDGECELPRKPLRHRLAPAAERLQQHFGVGLGAEGDALELKLSPQGLVVVDLAVERDHQPSVVRDHRLVRARVEIDDGEAPMTQGHAFVG